MESSEKNMFGLLLTLYIFIPVKYQCETDKNVSVLKKKQTLTGPRQKYLH